MRLEIARVNWLRPAYEVRDEAGNSSTWEQHGWKEAMSGDLDEQRHELRADGRRRFLLFRGGDVVARADAGKRGRWTILAGGSSYELRRSSRWRPEMEIRDGDTSAGVIRRARGKVVCDLPEGLALDVQVFTGLLAMLLWNRDAASSAVSTVVGAGSWS
jgi:hypothetical protein